MYISSNNNQLTIEDFFMPFGGNLLKTNRWVKLASIMPWEHIEEVYMESVDLEQGRPATNSRVAFGAIFIKENDNLTDEGTVAAIAENPYMQYFLGLTAFQAKPLFDSSMMTHFRKRFPVEFVAKVNEYVCTGKWPEEQRNVDRNDQDIWLKPHNLSGLICAKLRCPICRASARLHPIPCFAQIILGNLCELSVR